MVPFDVIDAAIRRAARGVAYDDPDMPPERSEERDDALGPDIKILSRRGWAKQASTR